MKIQTMEELYICLLKDIYNGETQMVKAMPKMVKTAVSKDLQQLFTAHLEETKEQVERLEDIFEELGQKPSGEDCEAMKGLIEEAEEFIHAGMQTHVMDAALIAAAQKIEHYEIGSYGTLCAFAKRLGYTDQADLLHETLEEEKQADQKLSYLAEHSVNDAALRQEAA